MTQNQRRPNRKLMWAALALGLLCIPIALACAIVTNTHFPAERRAPEEFPEADLIYMTNGGLGFVDADGSNAVELNFSAKMVGGRFSGYSGRATRPVISGDNQVVVVQLNPSGYFGMQGDYMLALWRPGELPLICWGWDRQPRVLLSAGQRQVFVETEQGLALYDLKDCEVDALPAEVLQGVSGVPSPDLRSVAFTQIEDSGNRFIDVLDLVTGEERRIGPGDYPAWSRDGEWLAYTGIDGIYVAAVGANEAPRRIISESNPYPSYENDPLYVGAGWGGLPPEVSWSPDGQWLAYHKWLGTESISSPDYYAIYKLNVASGEEIEIVEWGVYPRWRWPVEGQ